MFKFSKIRILTVVLLAALLISCMPAAMASGSFSAYVKSSRMMVFSDPEISTYCGSLPEKTVITVKAYSGNVAQISYKGRTGYAQVSDMGTIESIADKAVTNRSTYVFKSASTSSARMKVSAGLSVNVLAVKNGCAMVERGGNIGYMYASHLNIEGQTDNLPEFGGSTGGSSFGDDLQSQGGSSSGGSAEEVVVPQLSTADKLIASGNLSNEEMVFVFAVKKMGYNTAAAAGLLANLKAESSFRPDANGDSGTSYGICQWHASRKTRLINWCSDNGYDYTTLEGQLYFLKYELEKYYPSVHKYMKGVSDTAQGAYDAGYYFCYHFEAPANRASKSQSRGNSAKNTYYPKYA